MTVGAGAQKLPVALLKSGIDGETEDSQGHTGIRRPEVAGSGNEPRTKLTKLTTSKYSVPKERVHRIIVKAMYQFN